MKIKDEKGIAQANVSTGIPEALKPAPLPSTQSASYKSEEW